MNTSDEHNPIAFDEVRESDSPLIERVWSSHSRHSGLFTSISSSHCEIVFSQIQQQQFVTLRGPETHPSHAWCPSDSRFLGIRFRVGTIIRGFDARQLLNRQDITLPVEGGKVLLGNGTRFEIPTIQNSELFVAALFKSGYISSDEVVLDMFNGETAKLSPRSQQRRFASATGITLSTARQIERARNAVLLLASGVPIGDAVEEAGYYDQAHLTKSLKRFIGVSPSSLLSGSHPQLSLLYKKSERNSA